MIKNILFYILHLLNPHLKNSASILMYHSVGLDGAFSQVSPADFSGQLAYLAKNKFKVIKLSVLIEKIKNQEDFSNCVCLTFDDGYQDNYEIVFPLLKQYSFPASIFVATDYIGKAYTFSDGVTLPILNQEQIRKMSNSGLVEILPHTASHAILDKLSLNEAQTEIEQSREVVAETTGKDISILAYPKGKYNKDILDYLKNNNWLGAVTVADGLVELGVDLFQLKRNSIDSTTSLAQFKGKVAGAVRLYVSLKEKLNLWKK
jgi:peptidoglycan/xylan/chitin deacetylase (PgdA/CDA1 family)